MRHELRSTALACFALAGCLVAGCGHSDEPALPDVPVSLAFSGNVQGTMSSAINVHGHTDDDPMPGLTQENGSYAEHALTKTQCANFTGSATSSSDYLANVYGDVGGQKIALTIEFDPNGEAYENPGTPADPGGNPNGGGHAELYLPGEDTPRIVSPGPLKGNTLPEQSLVLNQDRRSGRIDAWFGGNPSTQQYYNGSVLIHVVGDWRCG